MRPRIAFALSAIMFVAVLAGAALHAQPRAGAKGVEPIGGQPPAGAKSSVPDLEYQVMYHRAFEAVIWSIPAVAIYRMRAGAFDNLGMQDNMIMAYSAVATPKLEALTANSNTPYLGAYTDLRKGPVVLEVPATDESGSLYGQVVNAWQFTIADVGPFGLDKGKQSKYLFTPPGYDKPIPEGYIQVAAPSFRIAFAFRSVIAKGKTQADAHAYAKKLKMYFLSELPTPKPTAFYDPAKDRYPTLPFFDERFFADVHAIFSVEPVAPQDKVMMGMLRSIGIQRGKPFAPTDKQKKAMKQAVVDAYFYMDRFWENVDRKYYFWPDRNYVKAQFTDENRGFSYVYDDYIDIDGRAAAFFPCTYMPREITDKPANWYIVAQADKDGKRLEAGKTYKVTVPKDVPVKQFWSLIVYDRATFAFIYTESQRTGLSSLDMEKLTANSDGSITLYIGPKAPAGQESNWIPTRGKRPYPLFRFYGATDELHNRTFKMPDFELVT